MVLNENKKDPRDFALWKFNTTGLKRDMEWDSPWGRGFPGWHIECSAMSMKYLGDQLDIHIGGEDLRSTHHPNEIAQSESCTGKTPFVKYWIHGAFLQVDGGRMGKSLGNAYTLQILKQRMYDPVVLRYFYLTGHYRKPLNFTWTAMAGAKRTYLSLVNTVKLWKSQVDMSGEMEIEGDMVEFLKEFEEALEDDLNIPKALGVMWSVVRSGLDVGQLVADLTVSVVMLNICV